MTVDDVIAALEKVKRQYELQRQDAAQQSGMPAKTKGGYFRVWNIAIKIAEVTELK